ncbi:hypothetical protein ES703_110990 [subsurface metagenome]
MKVTTPRCVYNLGTIINGIPNSFNRFTNKYLRLNIIIISENFQGHHLDVPTNAGNTHTIITDCADDSRYMGAVKVIISGVAVTIIRVSCDRTGKIITINIIYIAVVIVVNIRRTSHLFAVHPYIIRQVRM